MIEIDFEKIDNALGNGWVCALILTLTPGIVRIQLMSPGEFEPGWRKCIEAESLDKALNDAIEFTHKVTWQEYGKEIIQ